MLKNSVDYELFSDILSDNFLTQMVLQPTRGDSILDLVLTNNSDVICDVEVGEPISHHNRIVAVILSRGPLTKRQVIC